MRKVRQGFDAAHLTSLQSEKLVGVFDALDPEKAREVSDRTRFSVSTGSKLSESIFGGGNGESRREMSRAILFLADLKALYEGLPLPARTTDAAFETMWRGKEGDLRATLSALATQLIEVDTSFREIFGAKVVKSYTPPPRRKVVLPEDARRLLEGNITAKGLRRTEVAGGLTSVAAAKTAWSDAKTRLIADFTVQLGVSLSNIESIQIAATGAYTEFESFFRAAGKETEAKLGLAKSFFSAVADYAPFPVSVLGKIGGAAVGVLHVDTSISQTRRLGSEVYFNSDIPALARASAKLAAVKNWGTDLTRLGVSGNSISSATSIRDTIDAAKQGTLNALIGVFTEAIMETYGDSPSDMADKSTTFFQGVANSLPGARTELVTTAVVNRITQLSNLTRESIRGMGALPLVGSETLQPFIELQLFAEYLAQLAPGDDFDVSISDELIRRLEGEPFRLVIRKTGSGQTADIYRGKQLPWTSGHPKHVGGLILFFRWYAREVNAFHIAAGATTPERVRTAMGDTIVEIGQAISGHTVTRMLRNDTADWGAVRSQLRL